MNPNPSHNKQDETLKTIRDFIAENGYSPSVADLADKFKINGNAVQGRLLTLVRSGKIARNPGVSRSIRITGQ
jgi:SOS-response transcriptional repressor LexA